MNRRITVHRSAINMYINYASVCVCVCVFVASVIHTVLCNARHRSLLYADDGML